MNRKLLEAWKKHRQKVKSDPDRFGNLPRFDLAGELRSLPTNFFDIMKGQIPDSQVALGSPRSRRMVRLRQALQNINRPKSPTIGQVTRPEKVKRLASRNIGTVRDAILNTAEKRAESETPMMGKLFSFKRDNLPGNEARKERRTSQYVRRLSGMASRYAKRLGINYTTPRQLDVFSPGSQN